MYGCVACMYTCVPLVCSVPMKARRTQNWGSRELRVDLEIIRGAFGGEFDQDIVN